MSACDTQPEYVGIGRAAKIAGRSMSWIMTRQAHGEIDVRLLPGKPPRYRVADIEALIASPDRD